MEKDGNFPLFSFPNSCLSQRLQTACLWLKLSRKKKEVPKKRPAWGKKDEPSTYLEKGETKGEGSVQQVACWQGDLI